MYNFFGNLKLLIRYTFTYKQESTQEFLWGGGSKILILSVLLL
jgi:hypothetical protein